MSFDSLAPHYRWMEWLLAGNKLQRCRTAFLNQIAEPENVLILGEGNGRFLVECRRAFPRAQITCVDSSAKMLAQAKKRLQSHSGVSTREPKLRRRGRGSHAQLRFSNSTQTEFIHADVLEGVLPANKFDLLVTHFFLDCFRADQLEELIPKLAFCLMPQATWLLADFQSPAAGWRRSRAEVILWLMHAFFRVATRLPAQRLTSPDNFLESARFRLRQRSVSEWGLLHSDWWER